MNRAIEARIAKLRSTWWNLRISLKWLHSSDDALKRWSITAPNLAKAVVVLATDEDDRDGRVATSSPLGGF